MDEFAPTSCSGIWTWSCLTWEMPGEVVDGLPLHGGRQLAVDTTLVGVLHANGQPMRRTPDEDGVRLVAARQKRKDLHRTGWPTGQSHVGCPCWRSRWTVVRRDHVFLEPACQSSGSLRIHLDEEAGGTSLAPAVDVHALLCRRQGCGFVLVGFPSSSGCRRCDPSLP